MHDHHTASMKTTFLNTNCEGSLRQDFVRIIGQNTQENNFISFQINAKDVRSK